MISIEVHGKSFGIYAGDFCLQDGFDTIVEARNWLNEYASDERRTQAVENLHNVRARVSTIRVKNRVLAEAQADVMRAHLWLTHLDDIRNYLEV